MNLKILTSWLIECILTNDFVFAATFEIEIWSVRSLFFTGDLDSNSSPNQFEGFPTRSISEWHLV